LNSYTKLGDIQGIIKEFITSDPTNIMFKCPVNMHILQSIKDRCTTQKDQKPGIQKTQVSCFFPTFQVIMDKTHISHHILRFARLVLPTLESGIDEEENLWYL